MDVTEVFKVLGLEQLKSRGSKKWIASCPFAPWRHASGKDSHPSMSLWLEEQHGLQFTCYACGVHGDLYFLVLLLSHYGWQGQIGELTCTALAGMGPAKLAPLDTDSFVQEPRKGIQLYPFPEAMLANFVPWAEHEKAVEYLAKREVSKDVADQMGFMFDVAAWRIGVPVRTFDGTLVGFHGRSLNDNAKLKYLMYSVNERTNPMVWLGEHWLDLDEPILVVESVFDLARVLEITSNAVCPLTAMFSGLKASRLKNAVGLVSMFDNDEAGIEATKRLKKGAVEQGPKKAFHVVKIPKQYKDPGEIPVDELRGLLKGHVKMK